jgi:hypothetical protein
MHSTARTRPAIPPHAMAKFEPQLEEDEIELTWASHRHCALSETPERPLQMRRPELEETEGY